MLPTLSWATTGAAQSGDFAPGQALSTAGRTVPAAVAADAGNIAGITVAPALQGTPAGHPVSWWIALVALYLITRYFFAQGKEYMGFWHVADTTVSAIIGLSLAKWFFTMVTIPGLSSVVLSA